MRRTAALLLIVSSSLAPFLACSDGSSTRAGDDALSDDAQVERVVPFHDSSAADTGPAFNTDGWLRVDFDPNCSFYTAPSADKMPQPIDWQPCSQTVGQLGLMCKQTMSGAPAGWVDASGKAWLVSSVSDANSIVEFAAEADGPVHMAISSPVGGKCTLTDASINGGKAVFEAIRTNGKGEAEQRGAIGGDVDKPAVALESWADGVSRSYIAGPVSYFALGPENAVRPWTPGAPAIGTVTVNDPGQIGNLAFVGAELFFDVSNLANGRIKVYSPATGARDLVSLGNDVSAYAADFGTDGADMVWIEAFGRTDELEPFTTINIVTSKFTSDAAQIQKRRLRSESGTVGASPFAVGCGFAARDFSTLQGNGIRIVRLSDGWSWRLKQVLTDGGPYWQFQAPLAVTCEELFLNVNDSGKFRVARIRLDSLGTGEAAD